MKSRDERRKPYPLVRILRDERRRKTFLFAFAFNQINHEPTYVRGQRERGGGINFRSTLTWRARTMRMRVCVS